MENLRINYFSFKELFQLIIRNTLNIVLGNCTTLDALNQEGGIPCIFPFTYGGKTYSECSNSGGTCSWCATKLDSSGAYILGFWGCCNDVCPKEDQKGTFFKFEIFRYINYPHY